jgi:hypothetical protein
VAGLRWAGFDAKDILRAGVYLKTPGVLLIANAIAADGGPGADAFRRKSGESLDDWVDRMRAHAIAQIPALKPYEKEIDEILGDVGDVTSTIGHSVTASFQTANVTKVLVQNSLSRGFLQTPSLDGGWLQIDGTPVRINLRVKGLRKGSRSLDISHLDRHYTYTSTGQGREAVLRRASARVTIDRAVGKSGVERAGRAEGDLDATDLAIALVLEQVDTACLTLAGALLSIPRNLLLGNGRDEG